MISDVDEEEKRVEILCEGNMSEEKVIVSLAYLIETLYQKKIMKHQDCEQVIERIFKIVEKQLESWIREHGGLKNFTEENVPMTKPIETMTPTLNEKPTKSNENIRGLCVDKLPMIMMLMFIVKGIMNKVDGIQAYDCSKPQMGKICSLMDLEECPEAFPAKNENNHSCLSYISGS